MRGAGTVWYRFSAGPLGATPRVIKDFGPDNTLAWATIEREGGYNVQVDARNLATGEIATTVRAFRDAIACDE